MQSNNLYNSSFIIIAMGNFISRIGTVIFELALAWWVVEATGSAKYISYILAAAYLPIAILGPICGVLSDKFNRKLLLIISDTLSGIVTIGVALMAFNDKLDITLLILASFILGVCSSLFKPTIRSIVPELVSKDNLIRANAITTNLSEITKVIGPLIAGVLLVIPSIGVPGALLINGISFLIPSFLTIFVKYTYEKPLINNVNIIDELKKGLKYINEREDIKKMLLLCGLVNFFLVSFTVLLPLYVLKVIDGPASLYSYTLSSHAVGGIIVTIYFIIAKKVTPNPQSLAWFITLTGISLLLIPILKTPISLIILAFLQGVFTGAFNIQFFTYVQNQIIQEYLGRVFSIIFMISTIVLPISYLTFGYLGDKIINSAFIYAGLGTILFTLPLLKKKKINELEYNSKI